MPHENQPPEINLRRNHWHTHSRQWRQIGSPLRPCAEDVALFRAAVNAGRSVLLGVTPELADISNDVTAIDINPAMIAAVWPGNRPGRNVVRGNWLRLPFADASQDNVVGDGCPVLLQYLRHRQFFTEASRILRPGGRLVIRFFAAPEVAENCADVGRAAQAGRIGSFHAFKWRLAMALAGESGAPDIAVRDIYRGFARLMPDRQKLADCSGWSLDDIATIDAYSDSNAIYSFPTLAQLRAIMPPMLRETACIQGGYELAERCPILIWERVP